MSTRPIRSEAALAQILARPGYRLASQIGGEHVDTTSGGVDGRAQRGALGTEVDSLPFAGKAGITPEAGIKSGPLTLPWPPTGNLTVRHSTTGAHYLTRDAIAFRDIVADICALAAPIKGQYRLHVHLSPPDKRRRDADNALKSILDAVVKGGYIEDDSLTYMRELVVTVDDDRRNRVTVRAMPMERA